MYHLEFTISHQSFINRAYSMHSALLGLWWTKKCKVESCLQRWTMASGQSSETEWGNVPVRLYCEVETKGSAVSELTLTHAGVTRSPDRKSARLISTGHSLLLHQHSEEHSYHKFASFSWQAVISLSKCTPGGKKSVPQSNPNSWWGKFSLCRNMPGNECRKNDRVKILPSCKNLME